MSGGGRFTTVIAAGLALLCLVLGLPLLVMSSQAFACGQPLPGALPPTAAGEFDGWSSVQVRHAAEIVSVGMDMKVTARGWVIALATAMQESGLHNLANDSADYPLVREHSMALLRSGVGDGEPGRDHDSVGLFQQRPLPPEGAGGWGTVAELMTPTTSARKFYGALLRVDGWESMPLTDAAQAVQRSGFPTAYAKHEEKAKKLAAYLAGVPDIATIGGGDPGAQCGPGADASDGPVVISPSGWTQPVHAGIVSPFGQRDGRLHAGDDLGAPRWTNIRAAATGVVITSRCNALESIGCDQDGSPATPGCGWYVEIRHDGGITTRYCHQVHEPYVHVGDHVVAGQIIGQVGSSGHSSGPHLHFEVHLNVPEGQTGKNWNAVDPAVFMATQGAPLGQ